MQISGNEKELNFDVFALKKIKAGHELLWDYFTSLPCLNDTGPCHVPTEKKLAGK